MTLRVRFDPAVLDELRAAERWYECESPGVGEELLVEVWRVVDRAAERPGAAPLVAGPGRSDGVRQTALRRFAYGIVYLVLDDMLDRRPGA